MPLILGTNSIKDTGYDVANSVRLQDAYFSKSVTPSSATSWTLSFWIKISGHNGSSEGYLWSCGSSSVAQGFYITDAGYLGYYGATGYGSDSTLSQGVLRDNSAWYNIIFSVNSGTGTLYINGVQDATMSSVAPLNAHTGNEMTVNTYSGDKAGFDNFLGYMAEYVFIDGTALDQNSFGEFDSDSPTIWKPKDVSGLTFGTNGFYLDFEDSSNLGNDVSGNNNDYTSSGLASTDQSTDTCTNNFATMNPLDNYYANSTFSEGNLKYTQGSSRFAWNLSTIAVSSGKWYAEVKLTTSGSFALIGITDRSPVSTTTKILGSGAYDFSVYQYNGDIYNNAGDSPPNDDENYASAYSSGDIIGIALDLDNNKLYFSKNGQWSNGSGSWDSTTFNSSTGVVTITAPASTNNGHYLFASGDYQGGVAPTFEWNFGGTQSFTISSGNADDNGYGNFEYDVPAGFYALNTKNLAEFG
jgi:hypothetical protein